jgi:hypothetical protein
MALPKRLRQFYRAIRTNLPHLTQPQAKTLALWSDAILHTGTCGLIPIAEPEFTNSCACRIPPLPALSPLVKLEGVGFFSGGIRTPHKKEKEPSPDGI